MCLLKKNTKIDNEVERRIFNQKLRSQRQEKNGNRFIIILFHGYYEKLREKIYINAYIKAN